MSRKEFHDPEFVVIRTPSLPLDTLLSLADGLEVDLDFTDQVIDRLLAFWRSGALRSIALWAEPVIVDLADAWLSHEDPTKRARAARAVIAALTRATCRPVPMRAFGSVTFCPVDEHAADLPLTISADPVRKISLEYLDLLHEIRTISTSEEARGLRQWVRTATMTELAGAMRYVRRTMQADHNEAYELAQFATSDAMSDVLQFAAEPRSAADLVDKITGLGVDAVAAASLVDSLISEKVIVSTLLPMVHQPDPVSTLRSRLDGHAGLRHFADRVRDLQQEASAAEPARDGATVARSVDQDRSIAGQRAISRTVRLGRKLHHGGISRQTLRSVLAAAEVLQFVPTTPDRSELQGFATAFADRYGHADVPLLEVLDPVYGLGFGPRAATLTEVQLRGPGSGAAGPDFSVPNAPWTELDRLLARRVSTRTDSKQHEVVLSRTDLTDMPIQRPLPDSFSLRLRLGRQGARILLEGVDSSATRLVGALGALDPDLSRRVKRVCDSEADLYPSAMIADIDYLPEVSVSNIFMHPQYRKATIHLGAAPCAEPNCICILPSDLTVRVVGNLVRIYSESQKVEIIPRSSNPHNFGRWGPSIYRFLASLQHQDQQGSLTWSWGSLRYLSYLPRVRFGNCILALQTWRIQYRDRAMSKSLIERQLLDWGRDLLDAHRIPQCFTYRSANEDKVVDARNVVSLMMFAREASKAPGDIVIRELFPAPGDSPVQDESGAQYQHDIIVPYVRRHSMRRRPRIAGLPQPEVQREFPPGSECLFVKWYGSEPLVDNFITTRLQPMMQQLMSTGSVRRWFFIRYADPDWHLRLRLFGEPADLLNTALPTLRQEVDDHLRGAEGVRLCLDTYVREIERYGGSSAISPAESFFHADSSFVAETLRGVDEADRWKLATLGADQILRFLVRPQDRGAILSHVTSARQARRPMGAGARTQLRQLMEIEKPWFRELVRSPRTLTATDPWNERGSELLRLGERLDQIDRETGLTAPIKEIAWVLVHMYLNRTFQVSEVDQEAGLCWILDKLYRARERQDLL